MGLVCESGTYLRLLPIYLLPAAINPVDRNALNSGLRRNKFNIRFVCAQLSFKFSSCKQ